MRNRNDIVALKTKAVASLKRSSDAFNSSQEEGRVTTVLLHLQHAFEMLLKAALVQKDRGLVLEKDSGFTKGFNRCLNLAQMHLGVTTDQAGVLRAIDQMRDHEQHYYTDTDEGILHLHCQAAVSIFDSILWDSFGNRLADFLPGRVLPLSTIPPEDFSILVDRKFSQAQFLLRKGQRKTSEARSIVRGLLALEAHSGADDFRIGENDVERTIRAIKRGRSRDEILPGLVGISTSHITSGRQLIEVRFCRNDSSAIPVRYAGEGEEAAVIRRVDWQQMFPFGPKDLADQLGINTEQCKALRWKLKVEEDPKCFQELVRGKTKWPGFSSKALESLRIALRQYDLKQVVEEYRAARKSGGNPPARSQTDTGMQLQY